MKRIFICGFDYESTEKLIDEYAEGEKSYSAYYADDHIHNELKVICHVKLDAEDDEPFIAPGDADIIRAKTCNDAGRYIEWIAPYGRVEVDDKFGREGERYPQLDMYKYLKKQEEEGNFSL